LWDAVLIDASEKSLFRWQRFLEVLASGSSGGAADVAAGAAVAAPLRSDRPRTVCAWSSCDYFFVSFMINAISSTGDICFSLFSSKYRTRSIRTFAPVRLRNFPFRMLFRSASRINTICDFS